MASFKDMMEKRVSDGLSRVYPNRRKYSIYNNEYYFCNHTCTVFCRRNGIFIDLDEYVFQELLRSYGRELKNNLHHGRYTISYNTEVSSEDGADCFIDLFEDKKSPVPEDEFFCSEYRERISSVIDRLKPIQERVIRGIYFEQKTEAEMAELLGTSQANVHYHKAKALEMLKGYFEELEPEDLEL